MSVFKDKTLLITGGTGSFGNAVLNRFLRTDIGEIRIFSRDEKKQDDMRHDFQARMPEVANKIKFYIGDVRNKSTLKYAMKGVDYVFRFVSPPTRRPIPSMPWASPRPSRRRLPWQRADCQATPRFVARVTAT